MTFVTAPSLETDRLRLRAHTRTDFADSAALWANPDVVRHITGVPSTEDVSWARLTRYMGMWALSGFGYWVVEDKETSQFLGEVGIADFRRPIDPPIAGLPEAGWVMTPKAQGKGFATEAMRSVMAWADQIIKPPKYVCILDPNYAASHNVALKLGFRDVTLTTYLDQPTLLMERITPS